MRSRFANSTEWAFAEKDKTVLIFMQPKSVENISTPVFVRNRGEILENASILIEVNVNGTRSVNISTKVNKMIRETMKTRFTKLFVWLIKLFKVLALRTLFTNFLSANLNLPQEKNQKLYLFGRSKCYATCTILEVEVKTKVCGEKLQRNSKA